MLTEVQSGSPAEAAGFLAGDHLVRVGDLAVNTPLDIERALLDAAPGKPTQVQIRRVALSLEAGAGAVQITSNILDQVNVTKGAFSLGVIGGLVGGWLFEFFGKTGLTGFNLYSMFVAIVGAVIVLVVYHAIRKVAT